MNISLSKYRILRPSFKNFIPLGIYKIINDNYEQNNKTFEVNEILSLCCYLGKEEFDLVKKFFFENLNYNSDFEYKQIPLVKGVKLDETFVETIVFEEVSPIFNVNEKDIKKAIENHIKEHKNNRDFIDEER